MSKGRKWFYFLFFCINLLLSSYYLDVWLTPNATSRALPVLTLYENKSIVIDKYKDYSLDRSEVKGHYYSDKAPLGTFLVYPFYYIYKSMGLPELKDSTLKKYPIYILAYPLADKEIHSPDGRLTLLPKTSTVFILADILCGVIPFTIAMLLSLLAASKASSESSEEAMSKKNNPSLSPVITVMLSFYASFVFAYAGTFTGHVLSGVFALTGYIFIKKKSYLLAGLMVGLAVATEFTVGILIPVWAILIFLNEYPKGGSLLGKIAKPALFSAGLIPGILFIMLYNLHVTGSPLLTPYSYLANDYAGHKNIGFTQPSFGAFFGITFSTYRGMFFYAPVLFLLFCYTIMQSIKIIKGFLHGKAQEFLIACVKNYLLVTVITYTLLISSYFMWSGGWSYGPRQIMPLVIICLYEGVIFLSAKKRPPYFFYFITAAGLLVTWMDKSTKVYEFPDDPSKYYNPVFDVIIPDFFQHKFNTNTLPVFLFDWNPVLSIYVWPLLFLVGLIILTRCYSKTYFLPEKKTNFYIPVLCLIGVYAVVILPINKNWKQVDTAGIYGEWPYYDRANGYWDSAQASKDLDKGLHYYALSGNEFKKINKIWTGYPIGFYNLGRCYDAEGYKDSAIGAFKNALRVNPKFVQAANYLGVLYFNKEQYDTAIHYFGIICTVDPANRDAYMNIGKTYQKEQKRDSAEYYFNIAGKL